MLFKFSFFLFLVFQFSNVFSYSEQHLKSANFLSAKGFIVNQKNTPEKYNLDNFITRKEFMKVTMNISGFPIKEGCSYKFIDVLNDWSCKYIELGLSKGFLTRNKKFRPNDNISQAEALKLVFKARKIQNKYPDLSWEQGHINTAFDLGLLSSKNIAYTQKATRGWIFVLASKTFSDYSFGDSKSNIGKTEKTLVDGKIDGVYKEYFSNDLLRLEANYRDGLLHGKYVGYYENGSKNFESEYKNGKLEGEFIKYYENGVVSQKESYIKGLLTGYSYFYNTDGSLKEKREYIGGFLLE